MPMNETDSLRGFVALGLRRQPWHWSEDAVSLVSFASEMFLSVLKRQETEEILQAMRFAIDKASDSVFWISSSGEITYANESASNILGYSNAELLRMKIWEISASMLEDDWPKHQGLSKHDQSPSI